MTTGEKLSSWSSVSNVSAIVHLQNLLVLDQYVDFTTAKIQEEILSARLVDTLNATLVEEEVLQATLVEESLVTTLQEDTNKGEIQC